MNQLPADTGLSSPVQQSQVPNTQNVSQQDPPSNVNVASSSIGTAAPTIDTEKRKLIQQQLVLLLHAHKCQKRERENQGNGEARQCAFSHCRTMKNVLSHITTCQAGRSCTVPHCSSSRQIISHWKNCTRSDCPVCLPLKHAPGRRQQPAAGASQQTKPNPGQVSTYVQRMYAAIGLPSAGGSTGLNQVMRRCQNVGVPCAAAVQQTRPYLGPGPADMQRAYAALGLPYNAGGSAGLNQVMRRGQNVGVPHGAQGTQPHVHLGRLGPHSTAAGQNPQHFLTTPDNNALSVRNRMKLGVALLEIFQDVTLQNPSSVKDWHQSMTCDLRRHLVQKIVQAILPTTVISVLKDKRMTNLIAYAQNIERDMYGAANDKEEYYQLLAEKIYKIQKELEGKRQKRKAQQMAQSPQVGLNKGAVGGSPGAVHKPINDVQAAAALCHSQTSNYIPHQVQLRLLGPRSIATGQTLQKNLTPESNPLSVQNKMKSGDALLEAPLCEVPPVFQDVFPQSPSSTKDWHESVTRDQRRYFVYKIVQATFPDIDISSLTSKRMKNLIAYFLKLEEGAYETANSREEYYQLLAEKLYNIQKEIGRQQVGPNIGDIVDSLGGNCQETNCERTASGLDPLQMSPQNVMGTSGQHTVLKS